MMPNTMNTSTVLRALPFVLAIAANALVGRLGGLDRIKRF